MTYFPCPSCHRHVRLGDAACPFCASDIGAVKPAMRPAPRARLSRSATFLFASTVAVGVGACSGEDAGNTTPVYGSPADTSISETATGDSGKDSTAADTAPADTGTAADGT